MGSSTYTTETILKVCALLKVTTLRKDKIPISIFDHPELDSSSITRQVTALSLSEACLHDRMDGPD